MYEERLGKLNMNAWLSTNLIRDQEINLQLFNSQNVNVIGEADLKKKMYREVYFPVDWHQNFGKQQEDSGLFSASHANVEVSF